MPGLPSVARFRTSVRFAFWWLAWIAFAGAVPDWLRRLHAAQPPAWGVVAALLVAGCGAVTAAAVREGRRSAEVGRPPWRRAIGVELLVSWALLLGVLAWSMRPAA